MIAASLIEEHCTINVKKFYNWEHENEMIVRIKTISSLILETASHIKLRVS